MAKHPLISNVQLSRGLTGAWKIEFSCPGCHGALNTKADKIGKPDDCPLCGATFIVSTGVKAKIDELESNATAEREAASEQAAAAKDQRKRAAEEKQAERERLRDERREERNRPEFENAFEREAIRCLRNISMAASVFIWIVILNIIFVLLWGVGFVLSRPGS